MDQNIFHANGIVDRKNRKLNYTTLLTFEQVAFKINKSITIYEGIV